MNRKKNAHSSRALIMSIIATMFVLVWTIVSLIVKFIPFVFFGLVVLFFTTRNLINAVKNLNKGLSNEVEFIDDNYNKKDKIR